MNLILTNNGENHVDVKLYSPVYPHVDTATGDAVEGGDKQYPVLHSQRHVQKTSLIIKENEQVNFPIFTENVYWNWLRIEEYSLRGNAVHENDIFKLHFVNVKTDPHPFTVSVYKKFSSNHSPLDDWESDDWDNCDPPSTLLEEEEYISHIKDYFKDGIDMDYYLMHDKPPTPEDINAPIWLFILRGSDTGGKVYPSGM